MPVVVATVAYAVAAGTAGLYLWRLSSRSAVRRVGAAVVEMRTRHRGTLGPRGDVGGGVHGDTRNVGRGWYGGDCEHWEVV